MIRTRGAGQSIGCALLVIATTTGNAWSQSRAFPTVQGDKAPPPISDARDDVEAIVVRVTGIGEGCPSSTQFFESMQRRAPGIRIANAMDPARVFSADLRRQDERAYVGRLRVQEVDGNALDREVSGGSCAEVADALALIASIAVRTPPASDAPREDFVSTADDRPFTPVPSRREKPPQEPVVPPPSDASAAQFFLRGFFSVRGQILPVALYGGALGGEVVFEGGAWQPSLGVAFGGTLPATAATDGIVAQSEMTGSLLTAQIFVSPVRARWGLLELRPYVAFELGDLATSGSGTGLVQGASSHDLWLSATAWGQVNVGLTNRWFVGASVGAEAHLMQYTFRFDPRDVYRVGAVGVAGAASISFRID